MSSYNRLSVQVLLEAGEGFVDLLGPAAEIGYGIRKGVVVLEQEQRGELFLIEFFHAHRDVMLEDEIEEGLLLGAESVADLKARVGGAVLAHDGDNQLSGGGIIGARVQTPSRLAPCKLGFRASGPTAHRRRR